MRQILYQKSLKQLEELVSDFSTDDYPEKIHKAVNYLAKGLPYWLTFVLVPGVEPTNNRAEQDLRELVVLRKIKQTLRNKLGAETLEILFTVLATWQRQGKHLYEELTKMLT